MAVPTEQRKRKQESKGKTMQTTKSTSKAATAVSRPTKTPRTRVSGNQSAATTKNKEQVRKRNRPVTKSHKDEEEEEEEDDNDVEMQDNTNEDSDAYSDSVDYEMDVDPMNDNEDEDNGLISDADADATPADAKRAKNEKGESSRMTSSQKRELLRERRAGKPNQDRIWELKKLWEKLRPQGPSKSEQIELVGKILAIINGDFAEFVFKHDMSRLIQSCMKRGSAEQRQQIAQGLKGHYLALCKSKYGHFLIIKIFNFCPRMRDTIVKEFQGHLGQLLFRQEAATVLEEIFAQHSTAQQRSNMIVEFYGPEYRLFKNQNKSSTLKDIIAEQPDKRATILKHMAEALNRSLTKGTINNSIVHRLLLEYLTFGDDNDITNMIGLVKEQIAEIVHTKDGAQAAMLMLAHSTPKDRKVMVRAFKPYVAKICCEEYGHWVLLRLFDIIDDTVLVRKLIVSTMLESLSELINDKYGHRVLLYLLVGRSPRYHSQETLNLLASGDAIRAKTSKKNADVRAQDISEGLLAHIAKEPEIVHHTYGSQVVYETIIHAKGDKQAAIKALVDLVSQPIPTAEEQEANANTHVLRNNLALRAFTTIIRADKSENEIGFAQPLYQAIQGELYTHAICTSSSFLVLSLMENELTGTQVGQELKAARKKLSTAATESPKNIGLNHLINKLK
ncbi:armadillo-type protein [Syncephalis plumigaleata]|nr:armadillo-type protein [Syncephalis plumigaleata]